MDKGESNTLTAVEAGWSMGRSTFLHGPKFVVDEVPDEKSNVENLSAKTEYMDE
jgi:hypothetical protein